MVALTEVVGVVVVVAVVLVIIAMYIMANER